MIRLAWAGAACATLAVSAACGGDESLSRAELASRADAVCAKYEQKLSALAAPQSLGDVEKLADRARPIVEDGIDELDDLRPPDELEDDYDRWIDANRQNLAVFDDLEKAAAEGDAARVQEVLADARDREEEADRLAARLGLDDCADD